MENYVVVQSWMTSLGLSASELLAFALIWGFTQDGRHTCHPTVGYIGGFCGVTRRGAVKIVRRLEESGLVKVTRTGCGASEYSIILEGVNKVHGGCEQSLRVCEQSSRVCEQSSSNNEFIINLTNSVEVSPSGSASGIPADGKKGRRGQVPPTLEEVREYAARHGAAESLATDFWLHYEGVGWQSGKTPIKTWYPIFLKWVKNSGEGR